MTSRANPLTIEELEQDLGPAGVHQLVAAGRSQEENDQTIEAWYEQVLRPYGIDLAWAQKIYHGTMEDSDWVELTDSMSPEQRLDFLQGYEQDMDAFARRQDGEPA